MKISIKKKEKIFEQIIHYLYSRSPEPIFTSHIAQEIARDEEYIKVLLIELKEKGILNEIKKNKDGKEYIRRSRWRLSNEVFNKYSKIQKESNNY